MTELRDITVLGLHNVTCHPKQANTPALTPASKVLDLPTPEGMEG